MSITTPDLPDSQLQAPADEKAEPILLHETDNGKSLIVLQKKFEALEEYVRYRAVLRWRKHQLYWDNVQYLAESMTDRTWLTPADILQRDPQSDIDPALYAKIVNVYKAHGEIIIGALSSGVPTVRFFPEDADNIEDVTTAKACSSIAELIQRQNKVRLLLMKSLYILYNQGLIAAYNDQKQDSRFGELDIPDYEDVLCYEREHYCPGCGASMGQEQWEPPQPQQVNGETIPPHPMQMQGPVMSPQPCPECGQEVQPEYEDTETTVNRQTGSHKEPKNQECIEIYGPMHVKIPMWARDQQSVPYTILETEESIGMMREMYEELHERILEIAYPDNLERESRVPTQYRNDFPKGICSVKRIWFRPWAFNYLDDKDEAARLKSVYKDGVYFTLINGELIGEILEDKLDDHWTFTENPLSQTLHAEPIGAAMIPLQDITNELTNLTLETIEFGISETFADTRFLDFDSYPNQEARPGQITPATVPSGMQMSQGFHDLKPAILSGEVEPFAERMTTMTQFVMGTFPSIFGGAQVGGGDTAQEYAMSKASALQRLSTTWTIIQEWWAKVIGKSVRSYIAHMKTDEKYVTSQGTEYVNVWIRRERLTGKIGNIEPEINETFPMSWAQKREVLLQLIQMGNEDIATVIRHPENAGMVASLIGIPEMYIPGDDDRDQQLYEIAQLIQGEPVPGDMGQMMSSIPVTPDLDNHPVAIEVCGAWLKSAVGLDAKENNSGGYANVLWHRREHQMAMSTQMMTQPSPSLPEHTGGDSKPAPKPLPDMEPEPANA